MSPNSVKARRESITVRLHPLAKQWIDDHVGFGKRFATQTHAVEAAVIALAEKMGEPIDVEEE